MASPDATAYPHSQPIIELSNPTVSFEWRANFWSSLLTHSKKRYMGTVIDERHTVGGRSVPDLSQRRASIPCNFISENGIVAVFGDENQFVSGDIRMINRLLSFERGHMGQIRVPKVPLREDVDVHMVPNIKNQAMEIRLWWNQQLVHELLQPLKDFRVHL